MYTVAATTIRKDLINIFRKLEKNEGAEGERGANEKDREKSALAMALYAHAHKY